MEVIRLPLSRQKKFWDASAYVFGDTQEKVRMCFILPKYSLRIRIMNTILHTLYPQKGRRDITDIPPRDPRFTKAN
jgi:hypothetical protein